MRASVGIALLAFCLPALAVALSVAGVTLPETVTAAGKTLHLNGAGLRTRFFVKVYVIGLYLERQTRSADEAVRTGQVRRVELHLLRALSGHQIAEAIHEGFKRGSPEQLPTLTERLSRLEALFPSLDTEDLIALTCIPGRGTVVAVNAQELGMIEGDDFAAALLAVWLGRDPVDLNLKAALLGA